MVMRNGGALLLAATRWDIAQVLAAYKAQILPELETAAGRVRIDLQGDGPALMIMRDLVVSRSRINTPDEYAAVSAYVAETDRDILRYVEDRRNDAVVTGRRPRDWRDGRSLYAPISLRDMGRAIRAARGGWQQLEQRHWEYRRAQNLAHPTGNGIHFVGNPGEIRGHNT
jgi:hypothetical protein